MATVDEIVNAKEFATLPAVATKVLNLLEQDDVDVHELLKIIETDPTLTLKLLRIANSPLYATRREISSVQQAIMMIGFSKLTNIVLGISIFSKFWLSTKKGAMELMNQFWWHSSSTGTLAKSIVSKFLSNGFKENEFLGGLLHQIGRLAMLQFDMANYQKVIQLVDSGQSSSIDAENEIFGINHVDVGQAIAQKWKLPEEISTIISYYYHPTQAINYKELVAAVNFAGALAAVNGADFYSGIKQEDLDHLESWQLLCKNSENFAEAGIEVVSSDIEEQLQKSSEFISALKS